MAENMPNITPLPGFVLLKIIKGEDLSGWQIEDEKELPQRGEVLAVGASTKREHYNDVIECPVKVGDVVVHSAFGWERHIHAGIEYRFCPFTKILGVING